MDSACSYNNYIIVSFIENKKGIKEHWRDEFKLDVAKYNCMVIEQWQVMWILKTSCYTWTTVYSEK